MRRVLYALLVCALPTLAHAQAPPEAPPGAPAVPPNVLQGSFDILKCVTATSIPPTVTCEISFGLAGQPPGATWQVGASVRNAAGLTGFATPVPFTTAVPPTIVVSDVVQKGEIMTGRITVTDALGIDLPSLAPVATRAAP